MDKAFALVTGASGGIGYELAKLLAADGYQLLLTARSEEKLRDIKSDFEKKHHITVHCLTEDLGQPGGVDQLLKQIEESKLNAPIEILINNAGFGDFARFDESDPAKVQQMLQLNITALTMLTRRLLPDMFQNGKGRIMNVSSTAAFQPGPMMAVYYASKAYVQSFSEAIAYELKDTGVSVTSLCPGPTQSGFQEKAAMEKSRLFSGMVPVATAAQVAKFGYKAMQKGRRVAIHGFLNRLMSTTVALTPRNWLPAIVYQIQKKEL